MLDVRSRSFKLGGAISSFLFETIFLIIIAFVIALIIKSFIVQPFFIPSESMVSTLEPGDRVLVNKFLYQFEDPKPGDIVVFVAPTDLDKDYIKRVIAVGGEKIEIKEGQVIIDDEPIEEPYALKEGDISNYGPLKIPDDFVFLMGDNRANSGDSRVFGAVKKDSFLGRAFAIYWPPSRMSLIH